MQYLQQVDRSTLADHLNRVLDRVSAATQTAGGAPVTVLIATKTQPAATIDAVLSLPAAAQVLRGENRVQELVQKGADLQHLPQPVHLIGPLQSNKVNQVLPWVSCIQSVASFSLAQRLSARVTSLDVMVQVNVSAEETKHGVHPDQAVDLALSIQQLPGLTVTGFMTIGANTTDRSVIRAGYAKLAQIRDHALTQGLSSAQTLSMGMSQDLEDAIGEGATIVRIGTAIFGAR